MTASRTKRPPSSGRCPRSGRRGSCKHHAETAWKSHCVLNIYSGRGNAVPPFSLSGIAWFARSSCPSCLFPRAAVDPLHRLRRSSYGVRRPIRYRSTRGSWDTPSAFGCHPMTSPEKGGIYGSAAVTCLAPAASSVDEDTGSPSATHRKAIFIRILDSELCRAAACAVFLPCFGSFGFFSQSYSIILFVSPSVHTMATKEGQSFLAFTKLLFYHICIGMMPIS